jgi:hypothetical protein
MTVRVRLANGAEDSYPPHRGCSRCGAETSGGVDTTMRCPDCGNVTRGEQHDLNGTSQGWVEWVPTSYWNVTVTQTADGGLSILRRHVPLGHYCPGAWTSWHAD